MIESANLVDKNKVFFLLVLLALATIGWTTTTVLHELYIDIIRKLLLVFFSLMILYGFSFNILKNNISKSTIYNVAVFFVLFIYGFSQSVLYGGAHYFSNTTLLLYIVLGFFISLALARLKYNCTVFFVFSICLYVIFLLYCILLMVTGGVDISIPPKYNFSSTELMYSQGLTKFFMYAALLCMCILVFFPTRLSRLFKLIILLSFFIFFILSFAGGARGDFLFGFLIILCFFYYYSRLLFFLFSLIFCALIYNTNTFSNIVDGFIIVSRFSNMLSENGFADFGSRASFFTEALNLLSLNPGCLSFGCGFNFFQYFYRYDFAQYPHNFLLELIISFGLPFSMLMVYMYLKGLLKFTRENGLNVISIFAVYTFMLSLKSGSIFEFLNYAFFIFFISYYLSFKFKN
ncbi:hypothetical protein H5183_20810 [Pseudoalteromonas sp. SR44-8]|uniref:hypothetical protein n=1 Tax=Pseudoalteromonas sp. SR44-8 TaxID=2760933 RepID=UPI001603DCEF|nr:hypothetical protein [Pseudoalteromonas sp. SR44-8]MBB1303745.1 hypothetical protein [Pseudoalteromonas sp. SR44-8]